MNDVEAAYEAVLQDIAEELARVEQERAMLHHAQAMVRRRLSALQDRRRLTPEATDV